MYKPPRPFFAAVRPVSDGNRSQAGDWLIFRRESGCIEKWSLPKNVPVPLGFPVRAMFTL
jgi:hypothetical protein